MDTKNPKKGKKGPWIKIVAAVVIVGALVAVGVLGIQGDWLQGKTNLRMVTGQPKTTATMPITTPITKVPTITQPVIRIISDSMAFDGQNITVTHPATIHFTQSTGVTTGVWNWDNNLNCAASNDTKNLKCKTTAASQTSVEMSYEWETNNSRYKSNQIKLYIQ